MRWASGKHARAICDRSGFEYSYREMVREPGTRLLVHWSESDGPYNRVDHPQNHPPHDLTDDIALRDARPDRDEEEVGIFAVAETSAGFSTEYVRYRKISLNGSDNLALIPNLNKDIRVLGVVTSTTSGEASLRLRSDSSDISSVVQTSAGSGLISFVTSAVRASAASDLSIEITNVSSAKNLVVEIAYIGQ